MDIGELLALVTVLTSVSSGLTEYLKSLWDVSGIEAALKIKEPGRRLVVQTLALASCLFVAFMAQFDVVHALYTDAPISVNAAVAMSGVLLFLPADGLKVLLEAIKAIRDAKEGQAAATRSFTAPLPHEPATPG